MDLPGFYYFPKVIEPDLAKNIFEYLNIQEWKGVSTSITGRKVQQYGFEYNYLTRRDTDYKKIEDIPDILLELRKIGTNLLESVIDKETFEKCKLNQCIVNKYEPGQGISAHIDKDTFGPAVVCFTIRSGTTMTFTRTLNREKVITEKYVEPNSVYIMTGDSRYEWKHEIKSRLTDDKIKRGTRISITFRTVDE